VALGLDSCQAVDKGFDSGILQDLFCFFGFRALKNVVVVSCCVVEFATVEFLFEVGRGFKEFGHAPFVKHISTMEEDVDVVGEDEVFTEMGIAKESYFKSHSSFYPQPQAYYRKFILIITRSVFLDFYTHKRPKSYI